MATQISILQVGGYGSGDARPLSDHLNVFTLGISVCHGPEFSFQHTISALVDVWSGSHENTAAAIVCGRMVPYEHGAYVDCEAT